MCFCSEMRSRPSSVRILFGESSFLILISYIGYASPPIRRIAGSRRVAAASKRAPVAPKIPSLPNASNPGATVHLEVKITTENLMAALVLSDASDAELESSTGPSTPSVGDTQTEICRSPQTTLSDSLINSSISSYPSVFYLWG
jgi:hypothetical protein